MGLDAYRAFTDELRARLADDVLFGTLVTNALVAAGRARRGETLSAVAFVASALKHLAALLWVPDDDLDPLRRFETRRSDCSTSPGGSSAPPAPTRPGPGSTPTASR